MREPRAAARRLRSLRGAVRFMSIVSCIVAPACVQTGEGPAGRDEVAILDGPAQEARDGTTQVGLEAESVVATRLVLDTLALLREPAAFTFGDPVEAVIHNEVVAVLDRLVPGVGVFALNGEWVGGVDGLGEGPGEFASPRSISLWRDSLLVLDPQNARLTILARDIGRDAVRTAPLADPRYQRLCVDADVIYAFGQVDSTSLAVLDGRGRVLRRFGGSFGDAPGRFAEGPMACMSAGVLAVSEDLGIARFYGLRFDLRWETSLPAFYSMKIEELPSGGVRYSVGERGWYERAVSALSLPTDVVVIQIGRYRAGARGRADYDGLRTILLDARDGEVLGTQLGVPMLVSVSDTLGVASWATPAPRVAIVRIRVVGLP